MSLFVDFTGRVFGQCRPAPVNTARETREHGYSVY